MKDPKISVITVCFNASELIEKTILSVIGQNYPNIEYIIIDGGSTDGTQNIINKYVDLISYWISEPDKGIYDAMNKGIKAATGEWVNFMNAGDYFTTNHVLYDIFINKNYKGIDIIYGDSTIIDNSGNYIVNRSSSNYEYLRYNPIFRHGASFVRTSVHKMFLFNLSKKYLGYALDSDCIHSMYLAGKRFYKVDYNVITYLEDGISNHTFKSMYYNFIIALNEKFSIRVILYYIYSFSYTCLVKLLKIRFRDNR